MQKRKQLIELMRSHKDNLKYIEGERPWKHIGKVDVVLPSATQNEVCFLFCSIVALSRHAINF